MNDLLKSTGLFVLLVVLGSIWVWIMIGVVQNGNDRELFISKCVVDNQTLPNPLDVCKAKHTLQSQ